eukprot:6199883-Pleurochrysis_carterae.AAC.2
MLTHQCEHAFAHTQKHAQPAARKTMRTRLPAREALFSTVCMLSAHMALPVDGYIAEAPVGGPFQLPPRLAGAARLLSRESEVELEPRKVCFAHLHARSHALMRPLKRPRSAWIPLRELCGPRRLHVRASTPVSGWGSRAARAAASPWRAHMRRRRLRAASERRRTPTAPPCDVERSRE